MIQYRNQGIATMGIRSADYCHMRTNEIQAYRLTRLITIQKKRFLIDGLVQYILRFHLLYIPRLPISRNGEFIACYLQRHPHVCGGRSLMRIRPSIAHIHRGAVWKHQDKRTLGIPCQSFFWAEYTLLLPRSSNVRCSEIIIVITLPTGQVGSQEIIHSIFLKHGRRFSHALYIGYHRIHTEIIITQTKNRSVMGKKIAFAILILKNAHVPSFDGLSFILKCSSQLIVTIDGLASSDADMRIHIFQVISVHQHHIHSGFRTTHHLHSLTHSVRPQDTIFLHRKYHSFKVPVY